MNDIVFTPETLRSVILIMSGALAGSISTIFVTWITKRSDERKHLREIIIKNCRSELGKRCRVSKPPRW